MSKDVATISGGVPANPQDLLAGLQTVGATIKSNTGGLLLRLLKSGQFVYGPDDIEIEAGAQWAVNPYSIQHGWACWVNSQLVDETMVPFNTPAPTLGDLPHYECDDDEGWSQQVSVLLQCVSGEDEGVVVTYKGTSNGMRTAIKDLIGKLVTQLQNDQVNIVPVLELDTDSYKHKKYGQIATPVLNLVDFIPMDGIKDEETSDIDDGDDVDIDGDIEGEAEEVEQEAKPARTGRGRRNSPEVTEESPPSSTGRRRRRASK